MYKIVSKDNNIALHDAVISKIDFSEDVRIIFNEGFDVLISHSENKTNRHKHTDSSEIMLKKAKLISLDKKEFLTYDEEFFIDFEILEFEHDTTASIFSFSGLIKSGDFIEITFYSEEILFCWNDFVADAWFQE